MEDWELKAVEDRESFIPVDEIKDGAKREALTHLLNVGEDQVTVTNYPPPLRTRN